MQKTLALIIKKQNLGETDRILTLISPVLGKKRVVVRGVRRPLSKLAGHLDTMMLSQVMLTDEDELPKVAGAVLAEPFENIRQSLDLLGRAYAVTRIIERVVVEDVAERPIFQLTVDCLSRLDGGERWPNTWLFFLAKLTGRLGLSISNFHCDECNQPITQSAKWLVIDNKFICQSCQTREQSVWLEANAIKLLKLLSLENFDLVSRVNVPGPIAKQIEEVYLRLVTEWLNKPWESYASLA